MFQFAEEYYKIVKSVLKSERRILGIPFTKNPFVPWDLFSLEACRSITALFPDHVLARYGMTKYVGTVYLLDQRGKRRAIPHEAFTSQQDPQLITDFVFGQFALVQGVTLDDFIESYPEVFYRRALVSDKNTIQRLFQIEYR